MLVDTHDELQAAWKHLVAAQPSAEVLKRFGAAPLSEPEALALAKDAWKDPQVRNRKKIEWQRWAQDKYRAFAKTRS